MDDEQSNDELANIEERDDTIVPDSTPVHQKVRERIYNQVSILIDRNYDQINKAMQLAVLECPVAKKFHGYSFSLKITISPDGNDRVVNTEIRISTILKDSCAPESTLEPKRDPELWDGDAKNKVTCSNISCDWHGDRNDALQAPDPFLVGNVLFACPRCCEQTVVTACDEPDCWEQDTIGTPTPTGYRRTCSKHEPQGKK